jgi:hypothetical protein
MGPTENNVLELYSAPMKWTLEVQDVGSALWTPYGSIAEILR